MTARLADRFDQVGAQFVGDGGQLGFVELAQVGRGFDARKARVARRVDHVRHFPLRRRDGQGKGTFRSEEHTSELQSLMRISYAVFCLKKKKKQSYKTI